MDNNVKIVDEQTGRIMDGRRYSDGLHQAIEAKENVKIEASTQTFATITLQNYFRMYNKLAGMTGTAETEAGEFWEIYKLDVVLSEVFCSMRVSVPHESIPQLSMVLKSISANTVWELQSKRINTCLRMEYCPEKGP